MHDEQANNLMKHAEFWLAPLRVLVAASTQTGATTRFDPNKARQDQRAGLGHFVHLSRELRDLA